MSRVLLLTSKRAYNTDDFVRAAERLGIDLALGTDRCHVLAEAWPGGALSLDFRDPEAAAASIAAHARAAPIAGIVPTDELTSVIAARAAGRLGLRANPIAAARTAGNKLRFRRALDQAGLRQPRFTAVTTAHRHDAHSALEGAGIDYPVVIKPLHLSASRGVMRADHARELHQRLDRLAALLADPEVAVRNPDPDHPAHQALIESFVPGREVAYEGLLVAGAVHTLALFDKPDPLDGPFFAETLYVTPSSEPAAVQEAIAREVQAAARAIGLEDGPVHAELRLGPDGPVVIELAARSIGGLCNRTLRFGAGVSLEELLLSHAAGRDVAEILAASRERAPGASGVYMLPVPARGVVRAIDGVDQARAVSEMAGVAGTITDVAVTARIGDHVVPLPEGNTYMGFVFATARTPGAVIDTLRRAVASIRFRIVRTL